MAKPLSKEKAMLLDIIELYKDMPFLWDRKNPNYKNKDVRNDGKKVLLDIYRGYDSNVTMQIVTKKIQNLRTGYFKELKKVKKSGRGSDEVYVPTLWYYDAMSFLGPDSEAYQTGRDTMETEDISSSSTEAGSVRRSRSGSSSSRKKNRIIKASILQKHNSLQQHSSAEKPVFMKEEEWEIIGKSIGLQLRNLNKRQFFIAQKIIHDTLYYAQMEMLTEETSVTGLEHTPAPHAIFYE